MRDKVQNTTTIDAIAWEWESLSLKDLGPIPHLPPSVANHFTVPKCLLFCKMGL